MSAETTVDVIVAGGGSAGLAAAAGAARDGARVVLIERYGFLGGQATSALVGTVCGLFFRSAEGDGEPVWAVGGPPRAFAEALAARSGLPVAGWREGLRFLPYDPRVFRQLADETCACVDVWLHTTVIAVVDDGAWRVDVLAMGERRRVVAPALVDATGIATAAALTGVGMLPREPRQGAALGFVLGGLGAVGERELGMAVLRATTRAVRAGLLDPEAGALSVVPGTLRRGRAAFKLPVRSPGDDPAALSAGERQARAALGRLLPVLRAEPTLGEVEVLEVATQLGVRTGRRPRGRVVLTGQDVLGCRRVPDAVGVGAWPVERWGEDHRVRLQLLPPGEGYDIPAGCLQAEVDGLYFAGRNLSADEVAVGSARVIGTCLTTGHAAGVLAAGYALGRPEGEALARLRSELVVR